MHFQTDILPLCDKVLFCQDSNKTTNKNALQNLEVVHKFILAVLEKVRHYYKGKSLNGIRRHLSNNFSNFFPEIICCLAIKNPSVF